MPNPLTRQSGLRVSFVILLISTVIMTVGLGSLMLGYDGEAATVISKLIFVCQGAAVAALSIGAVIFTLLCFVAGYAAVVDGWRETD